MVRILKTVCDAGGDVVAGQALPIEFATVAEARSFMREYVAVVFEGGRCGYDSSGGYWWGCEDSGDATLHRYVVEQ